MTYGILSLLLLAPGMKGAHERSAHEIRRFVGHSYTVQCVAVTQDNRFIISGSIIGKRPPTDSGSVRIWDVQSGKEIARAEGAKHGARCLCVTRDGKRIIYGNVDDSICLWELGKGWRRLGKHDSEVVGVACSSDGAWAVSGSGKGKIHVWDLAKRAVKKSFKVASKVDYLALHPNEQWIAVGARRGAIELWDLVTGKKVKAFVSKSEKARCLAFSPCGKLIVSVGADRTARVSDIASGRETQRFSIETIECAAFSPDSRRVALGCSDRMVHVWDLASGKVICQFRHDMVVRGVAFFSDNKQVVSCSGNSDLTIKRKDRPKLDYTVRIWKIPPAPSKPRKTKKSRFK